MTLASAINGAFQIKMRQRDVVKVGKGITSIISNKDKDNIIRIIKSLENLVALIDKVNETVLIITLLI